MWKTVSLVIAVVTSACEPEAVGQPESTESLCDGSDEIRLRIAVAGGFVDCGYNFLQPYGHRFAFVNGNCDYVVGFDYMSGVRTGSLTPKEAEALQEDLGYNFLKRWDAHEDQACDDSGTQFISDGVNRAACSCGCDDDAPEGLADSVEASMQWMDRMWDAGESVTSPVSVLLTTPFGADMTPVPWPLDSPSELGSLCDAEQGELVSDEETPGAAALRDLRATALAENRFAEGVAVLLDDEVEAQAIIVDQLPEPFDRQVPTFLGRGPWGL